MCCLEDVLLFLCKGKGKGVIIVSFRRCCKGCSVYSYLVISASVRELCCSTNCCVIYSVCITCSKLYCKACVCSSKLYCTVVCSKVSCSTSKLCPSKDYLRIFRIYLYITSCSLPPYLLAPSTKNTASPASVAFDVKVFGAAVVPSFAVSVTLKYTVFAPFA